MVSVSVCLFVCLRLSTGYIREPYKTAEPIEMLLGGVRCGS